MSRSVQQDNSKAQAREAELASPPFKVIMDPGVPPGSVYLVVVDLGQQADGRDSR